MIGIAPIRTVSGIRVVFGSSFKLCTLESLSRAMSHFSV